MWDIRIAVLISFAETLREISSNNDNLYTIEKGALYTTLYTHHKLFSLNKHNLYDQILDTQRKLT